jgi:FkbM family methyltransferase
MNLQRVYTALKHIDRLPEVAACLSTMHRAPRVVASYVGLRPLALPFDARLRDGTTYRLEESYDVETLWHIYFHRVYPLHAADRVIVDAGANVGLFTCWAAARNREAVITAVEPSPANFRRLVQHVRTNGFENRVQPVQAALSASERTVWLSERPAESQAFYVTDRPAPQSVEVPAMSLPALLERVPHDRIDFLKMDVEGSEYPVLTATPAGVLQRIRRISLEYHDPPRGGPYSKAKLIDYLKASGYRSIVDRGGAAPCGMIHASR